MRFRFIAQRGLLLAALGVAACTSAPDDRNELRQTELDDVNMGDDPAHATPEERKAYFEAVQLITYGQLPDRASNGSQFMRAARAKAQQLIKGKSVEDVIRLGEEYRARGVKVPNMGGGPGHRDAPTPIGTVRG